MAPDEITGLLVDVQSGRDGAFDELMRRVYAPLRQIAHARLRDGGAAGTFETTELVHEAYLRMVRYQDVNWRGRSHFFGAASQTMRRILVDHARAQASQKRKGEVVGLTLAGARMAVTTDSLIELDDLLHRLEVDHPRWVRIVECRYFAGLSIEETAETLGVSHATVSNDWRMARAWLKREIE
jgi:RNA polymerase sigma factor (TIGR02999 family)